MVNISSISTRILTAVEKAVLGGNHEGWVCLAGPNFIRSDNELPLITLRCLVLMLVRTPLRTVNCCCSGFQIGSDI